MRGFDGQPPELPLPLSVAQRNKPAALLSHPVFTLQFSTFLKMTDSFLWKIYLYTCNANLVYRSSVTYFIYINFVNFYISVSPPPSLLVSIVPGHRFFGNVRRNKHMSDDASDH